MHDHASHSSFLCKCFVQEACDTLSCDACTACATISFHHVFLLLFLRLLQPLLSLLGAFVLFLPLFLLGWLPGSQQLTQSSCRLLRTPPSTNAKPFQCQVAISRSFLTLRPNAATATHTAPTTAISIIAGPLPWRQCRAPNLPLCTWCVLTAFVQTTSSFKRNPARKPESGMALGASHLLARSPVISLSQQRAWISLHSQVIAARALQAFPISFVDARCFPLGREIEKSCAIDFYSSAVETLQ